MAFDLETYVYPTIGSVAVADVKTGMVVKILEPIWSKKTETANRVRGRIERILSRAASRGHWSGENPARWRGHLENVLPARGRVTPVKHHAALHYSQVGDFMTELRTQPGIAANALELTILCTTRTIETIGANPDEFDLAQNLWTIPAERMKMKREHRIPLTPRALEILAPRKSGKHFKGHSLEEYKPLSRTRISTRLCLNDRDRTKLIDRRPHDQIAKECAHIC
jgi:integrase